MRRTLTFLCGAALLSAGCLGHGRRGAIDESRFVEKSDAELMSLLGDFPTPGPNASNDIRDASGAVVALPADRARFADEVVSYVVGEPSPIPDAQDPRTALGLPDYRASKWEPPRSVSLGNGGSLTLKWNHAVLVDGEGPDLFVFEIGPSREATTVEVSADGARWIKVGTAIGGASAIDLHGRVQPDDVFRYVRLTDVAWSGADSDVWPGADIDAVAVIAAAQRLSVPSEVLFDFDSDALAPGAAGEIDRLARLIQARPRARVTIEGHTDDVGDDRYNLDLSERRARAVAEALVQRGAPRERITARGLGEGRPVAPNDGEEGRRKNRRVEIVIDDR